MIYFLQRNNGDVKIGVTDDYYARLSSLQSAHGNLELLGWCKGSFAVEREIHEELGSALVAGEWYSYNDEVKRYIKAHCKRSAPEQKTIISRMSVVALRALRMYGGEVQIKAGRQISDADALLALMTEFRPDLINRAKELAAIEAAEAEGEKA